MAHDSCANTLRFMDKLEKPAVDTLDRRLLAHLQQDGRASNVELSAAVHLSAPQCFRRVKALEERGVIRGYYDALAPDAVTKLLADTSHLLREQPK